MDRLREDNTILRSVTVDGEEHTYTVKRITKFGGAVVDYDIQTDSSINSLLLFNYIIQHAVRSIRTTIKLILYVYYPSSNGDITEKRKVVCKDGNVSYNHLKKILKGRVLDYTSFRLKVLDSNILINSALK